MSESESESERERERESARARERERERERESTSSTPADSSTGAGGGGWRRAWREDKEARAAREADEAAARQRSHPREPAYTGCGIQCLNPGIQSEFFLEFRESVFFWFKVYVVWPREDEAAARQRSPPRGPARSYPKCQTSTHEHPEGQISTREYRKVQICTGESIIFRRARPRTVAL